MLKMKNIINLGKSYVNTLNKAIAGKKLTNNQVYVLLFLHLNVVDFPIVPNSIILQLIDAYENKLADLVENESFENASEFRDIIISLKETISIDKNS
jgi:protein-arginine kinase activator protein McsA